ncbi:MAG: type Z 30S ribosomal protein S14 [Candidatus Gracilibacteria bacterium]|jgi:small subunit ribosomal protein S14
MARKALKVKQLRVQEKVLRAIMAGKKPVKATRMYSRCKLCGRNGGYMNRFEMCRICFRELASRGMITGVTKCSW